MAQDVLIHSGENGGGKVRNPWGVLGLTVITLGLYGWYWWFQINRELAQLGGVHQRQDLGKDPSVSMLAFGLGGYLIVPFIWTVVATSKRIQRAQRLVGSSEVLNGWVLGLLWLFTLGIGAVVYTQSQMNKWLRTQAPAASTLAEASARLSTGTPATPAPPRNLESPHSDLDRIEKLANLRDSGAITEEEFQAQKTRALGGE